MTTGLIIAVLSLLAAGLVLRFWVEKIEAMHLTLAGLLLAPDADDEDGHGPPPAEVATLLERTRMVLSATRLLRMATMLLLAAPVGAILLFTLDGWPAPAQAAVAAIAAFVVMAGFSWFAQRRGHGAALGIEEDPPDWLLRDDEHPPGIFMAGWLVWDRLLRTVDTVLHPLGVVRPAAQLVEIEDRVRLALEPTATNGASKEDEAEQEPKGEAPTEEEMIRSIQRLDRTLVREIMRPVNQISAIRLRDYNPRRFLALAARTGYTRIPVYEDHLLNLTGFINVYDLLEEDELPKELRPLVTEPLFVPELARVDQVLQLMIARKQQVAVVFDEFGGTSGWLSREDILEEIVGELEDEFERTRQKVVPVRGGWLVDPTIDLDDLEDELEIELPKKYADTLSGYIYHRLGRAPRRGETIEEGGWKIRVAGVDGHRIRRVRVIPPPETDGENGD